MARIKETPIGEPLRLAVLASGRGTNLQAIIDACAPGGPLDGVAEVAVVISDRRSAMALERARQHGIATVVLRPRDFPDRSAHDHAVACALEQHGARLICLAGYMRLFQPAFIRAHAGRIINVHPALLPAFPGLDVQRQALEHGVKVTGCTVHFVDEGTDTGPIIIQRSVAVAEDDTVETLSSRILAEEHLAYIEAIRLYAAGRLVIEGRRVRVTCAAGTSGAS